jgi:hypothetical protein
VFRTDVDGCAHKNLLKTQEGDDKCILLYISGISPAHKIVLKQTEISAQIGEQQESSFLV